MENIADWRSGEPRVLEPDKSEEWQWFDIHNFPDPMFEICKLSVDSFLTGRNYYDNF